MFGNYNTREPVKGDKVRFNNDLFKLLTEDTGVLTDHFYDWLVKHENTVFEVLERLGDNLRIICDGEECKYTLLVSEVDLLEY